MNIMVKIFFLFVLLIRGMREIFFKSPASGKLPLLLLLPLASMSQVSVQNNGVLYISNSGDIMHITGGFTNTSGAALTNNGMLYISQDLSNSQASMATGTGTLFLNGSSLQTISGTQTFKTYNLVTDNTAGFLLNNNLSASGVHAFTNGIISTSATPNYMIYEAGASYSGSGDARHVNGWVKKLGNTSFTFPVGNGTYLREIALSNYSVTGEFNARYNGSKTPNHLSLYNPLVLVDTFEYWTINRVSGGSAQVTMNWDLAKVPFPLLMLSDIRASYWDGTFWRSIGGSATGSVLSSGSITSNSTSAFNTDFVIGSVSWVLPVKIIRFQASRTGNNTRLDYVIGNELNVDHYEVERSDDGFRFRPVATQQAFNRNGTELYSNNDNSAIQGTAYYRLKLVLRSGETMYSAIVTVSDHDRELYVLKNPVSDRIDLVASGSVTGLYSYSILTTGGQTMQTGTINISQAGVHPIELRSAMAAGSYMLILQNANIRLQKMIIKQ